MLTVKPLLCQKGLSLSFRKVYEATDFSIVLKDYPILCW
ncbi:hypothetical protein DCCM_0415 [Desulfocucumis palustris]|uniref:Uncharacterized protein n=1 Tax=Desulfocucumis palustris TaxID=1898651 RepID=A0A2L2X8H3_9FIRM|nr:hypothetical protein DCCM_0415 [Desulfocucumis palustris]